MCPTRLRNIQEISNTTQSKKSNLYNYTLSLFRTTVPLHPLSKNILLELPRASLGEFVHNLNLPRDHELADPAHMLGPFDYVFALEFLSMFHRDEGLGAFTPVGVCDGDNTGFQDIRVLS